MIQSQIFNLFPELIHGFSLAARNGRSPGTGNMSLNKGPREEVLDNRKQFCLQLGIRPQSIVMADQVHSDRVFVVGRADEGKGALTLSSPLGEGDALCTREVDLPLSVLVADCAAVYLYDPCTKVIGLAHSGWRGTAMNISRNLIQTMNQEFGTQPADLYAWVSPCIGGNAFEVGPEVVEEFEVKLPESIRQPGWKTQSDKNTFLLNLRFLIQRQLEQAGLPLEQLEISPACTFQDDQYYSYRREGRPVGHMMGLLCRRPGPDRT